MRVTSWKNFCKRREFLKSLGACGVVAGFSSNVIGSSLVSLQQESELALQVTPLESVASYNNYYEFSSNKEAVKILAKEFLTKPWSLVIEGEVDKKIVVTLEDIQQLTQVNRVYSLRCVEGWSMVIPWTGIQLSSLLELVGVKTSAKYVEFIGTDRPSEMINQRRSVLPWPYTEALRIDEAMHPLTILATGMYQQELLPQNGAPIRLVVPWKYGFKSIKAIQKIVLTKTKPATSWSTKIPSEYGFYANVNPEVAHPRWSQSREVRIGELRKRPTKLFNGYASDVAYMYEGMDLSEYF